MPSTPRSTSPRACSPRSERTLRLTVAGVGAVDGVLRRAGEGWCLLDLAAAEWVVRLPAVTAMRGLVDGGVVPTARPLTARLGLGSVLRGLG